MYDYTDIPEHVLHHIKNNVAGKLGVDYRLVDPGPYMDYQPEPAYFDNLVEANQKSAAQRRERRARAAAGLEGDQLPSQEQADYIATRLGVDRAHIRTAEMAQAERDQAEAERATRQAEQLLKSAIKGRDTYGLIKMGETSDNPDIRAAARAAVSEIAPWFDAWRN